jgi:hypothetical protein
MMVARMAGVGGCSRLLRSRGSRWNPNRPKAGATGSESARVSWDVRTHVVVANLLFHCEDKSPGVDTIFNGLEFRSVRAVDRAGELV